jgi:type IV secretion system protein VirD4
MSAAALMPAAVLGAIALALFVVDRRLHEGGGARIEAARWARRRDLRDLYVSGPQRGRLILGRHGRRLLAAEERASVLVVGPSTISMKTSGLAIPAVLEWDGPVLAASVKSDLMQATRAHRATLGRAMVFDPTGSTGTASVLATPLWSCGEWRGALRVAHWLASSARVASAGLEDAGFWYAAAEKLLGPLLLAASRSEGQIADVVRWLDEGPAAEQEVTEILAADECAEALSAWRANLARESRQRSSIYTTAETMLAAYSDPLVLDTSTAAEYTPEALLDGKANTLYLCAPADEQERLRTVFATMIRELVATVYERAARTGKPLDPPLLLVLDEAANIAPVPNLDEIASSGAGQGIQLMTIFQDLAQAEARYDRRAQTIVNNHRARLIGAGVSDPTTRRLISETIGAAEFRQRSETSGERDRGSSMTESTTYRDLAPANVIREAAAGTALLVCGNRPAARLELRPWFGDARLRELVEGAPDDA